MKSLVLRRIGYTVFMAVVLAFFAIPMLWLASAPFDSRPGLGLRWPDWTWSNVRATFEHPYALGSLGNSLILCVTATAVTTVLATLAAYALSRVRIPGRDALLYVLLLLSSAPGRSGRVRSAATPAPRTRKPAPGQARRHR